MLRSKFNVPSLNCPSDSEDEDEIKATDFSPKSYKNFKDDWKKQSFWWDSYTQNSSNKINEVTEKEKSNIFSKYSLDVSNKAVSVHSPEREKNPPKSPEDSETSFDYGNTGVRWKSPISHKTSIADETPVSSPEWTKLSTIEQVDSEEDSEEENIMHLSRGCNEIPQRKQKEIPSIENPIDAESNTMENIQNPISLSFSPGTLRSDLHEENKANLLPTRECLTYLKDNIVHFLPCNMINNTKIGKLLADLDIIDLQQLGRTSAKIGLPMHRLARLATREAGSPTKTSSEDSGDLEANFPTSNLANLTITRTVTQVYTVTPLRAV
ncbi:hypothetical protein TKK_0016108 [Trichogramma kaykai]